MLASLLIFALIAVLLLLARWLYSGDRPETPPAEAPDPRVDKLAMLIHPGLMQALMDRAHQEGRPVLSLLEDLIAEGLERERPGELSP